MKRYIVLLRGINVGGYNKLLMADLRLVLTKSGYTKVLTYIQSGNIILQSDKCKESISIHIHDLIKAHFAYTIPVVVLTKAELVACVTKNPFLEEESDIKKLHVTFLSMAPKSVLQSDFGIKTHVSERYKIDGSIIYLHTPEGFAKTKFTNEQFEKKLDVVATTRNWRTACKLYEMITT